MYGAINLARPLSRWIPFLPASLKRPGLEDCRIADYGTRRRFSHTWHEHVLLETHAQLGAQYAGTSNVYFAMKHGMTEMSKSELYVQGCAKDGFPLVKKRPTFTCIRCATMMQYAGVRGINVWYHDDWLFIDTGLAIYQASQYATGKLEVDSK